MLEVANPNVTAMAQQSSNMTPIVAVVDVKDSLTSRVRAFADRAFAALGFKHLGVFAGGETIVFLATVIAEALRMGITILFLLARHVIKVLPTPNVVPSPLAVLAVNLQACHSGRRFVVFGERLSFLALRAGLKAGREVEINSARHGVPFL